MKINPMKKGGIFCTKENILYHYYLFFSSFCSQILISFYTFVVSEYAIPNPLLSLQTLNQFPSPLQPYLQSTHGAFW